MRLTTAKRMETDGLSVEIHVAANEPMRPKGVDPEGTAQQADGAGLRTTADEDDRSDRMGLQVRPPGGREWPPCGSRLDTGGGALAVGADIASGTLVEGGERSVVEANPNLGLPAAVEVFDGGLESTLLRRREDRSDPELQAGPHDAAQRILTVMAPLEDGVVVELGIGGSPNSRQCATSASTAVFAVTSGWGHEPGKPPCRETTLRTSMRMPPSNVSPSTVSKLSSSARPAPTSGRYQPAGGGGRRTRRPASRAPRRSRMRPMVRTAGTTPCPRAASSR